MGDAQTVMGFLLKCSSMQALRQNSVYWICSMLVSKQGNWSFRGVTASLLCCQKSGNLSETNNWRPIAILKITYKIFSSLLHLRLRRQLDYQQSADQVGFRPKTGVDNAFVVLEAIIGKTLEWQCGIWFASLDLRKAFDKVEHGALFAALTAQGIRDGYLDLLMAMYQHQTGAVPGSENFSIQRGVRQGDVLSPFLFQCRVGTRNAEMETEIDK